MWNHQTGGLVINIDMNIATIGDNLGGLLMDGAVSKNLIFKCENPIRGNINTDQMTFDRV